MQIARPAGTADPFVLAVVPIPPPGPTIEAVGPRAPEPGAIPTAPQATEGPPPAPEGAVADGEGTAQTVLPVASVEVEPDPPPTGAAEPLPEEPWRIPDGHWGRPDEALDRALPDVWLFTSDRIVITPSLGWPEWAPSVKPPALEDLDEILGEDPADDRLWSDYAEQLQQRSDPYAPVVQAAAAGQDPAVFFEGRSDRGRLLGDLPRLGSVASVIWDRGLTVTLDGRHPPLLISGVPIPTAFSGLDVAVEHLNPAGLRGLTVVPPIRSLRLHSATLAPLDLARISIFEGLQGLVLDGLTVSDLTPLVAHQRLARLALHRWWGTPDLAPLAELPDLRSVILADCPSITELTSVATLSQIRSLAVRDNAEVADLGPLVALDRLRALVLDGLDGLSDLEALGELVELVDLTLGSTAAASLGPIPQLQELRTLTLQRSNGIEHLRGLEHCAELRALSLDRCLGLTRVPRLGRRLLRLSVVRCRHIEALGGAVGVEELTLFGCPRLTEARSLTGYPQLKTLRLGLVGLTDLGDLSRLPALESVTVMDPDPDPALVAAIEAAEPWWLEVDDRGHLVARFDPKTPEPDRGPRRVLHDAVEAAVHGDDPAEGKIPEAGARSEPTSRSEPGPAILNEHSFT